MTVVGYRQRLSDTPRYLRVPVRSAEVSTCLDRFSESEPTEPRAARRASGGLSMAGLGTAARRSLARAAAPVAVFGVTVALGVAPALADPGNGNGAAASHSTNGTGGTFGDPTTSQPRQQPDNQGHGANTFPGPYSSTRDGSPSLNGKDDGLAVGQPCAACVGK